MSKKKKKIIIKGEPQTVFYAVVPKVELIAGDVAWPIALTGASRYQNEEHLMTPGRVKKVVMVGRSPNFGTINRLYRFADQANDHTFEFSPGDVFATEKEAILIAEDHNANAHRRLLEKVISQGRVIESLRKFLVF